MEEQVIICYACGTAEQIAEDSPRLEDGQWPAWRPGFQDFPCPSCGKLVVWATRPREYKPMVPAVETRH